MPVSPARHQDINGYRVSLFFRSTTPKTPACWVLVVRMLNPPDPPDGYTIRRWEIGTSATSDAVKAYTHACNAMRRLTT